MLSDEVHGSEVKVEILRATAEEAVTRFAQSSLSTLLSSWPLAPLRCADRAPCVSEHGLPMAVASPDADPAPETVLSPPSPPWPHSYAFSQFASDSDVESDDEQDMDYYPFEVRYTTSAGLSASR